MPAQAAVTIIDEIPGRGRQVAFKLELWTEKIILSKAIMLAADTRITDPTIMTNAVFAAGVLVLFGSATARASTSPVLHANVPFPFVVNGQAFPAGKYKIERDDTSSILLTARKGPATRPNSSQPPRTEERIRQDPGPR